MIFGCIESFAPFMEIFPIWAYLIIVFLGSIIAQAGDLFESYLKRKANVKDTGSVIAGHGGILDRIDSHIVALPYTIAFFALVLLIY